EIAQRHILEGWADGRRRVMHEVAQSRLFAMLFTRNCNEFVAQTKVEREIGQDAEIIVGVKTERVEMVRAVSQRTRRLRRILRGQALKKVVHIRKRDSSNRIDERQQVLLIVID